MTNCKLPPKGWECRLDAGHTGPCPAWPVMKTRTARLWVLYAIEETAEVLHMLGDFVDDVAEVWAKRVEAYELRKHTIKAKET